MALRNFGRNQQMWLLLVANLAIFGGFLWLIPDMTGRLFGWILVAALVASSITLFAFQFWLRGVLSRRESAIGLVNRISAGDIAIPASEIVTAARSVRMSSALRGLVSSLERTIRRFGQLATDVSRVSEQISGRARIMAHSSAEQLDSSESTSAAVSQIDHSINAVRASIQELSNNAEETSTSVLEMSASIEEVGRIADTLSEFVEQTSTGIEEMIASINQVAVNTESFSSFAIQTSSSIMQMNQTTGEIGRSAKNSAELAQFVKETANEGREAVTGTVDGMTKIQDAVEEAKKALADLANRSQEIGEIVRVIDEIAGQTNLLALNAAIIAAQAGERGKGFAVVADEIRDLSERTSVSTDEIRTLIENVQKGVYRASEQMNLSSDRVVEGVQLTARASQVLEKILDLTDRSTASISQIARATEEQARGSAQATSAIEEVTKMVQQTATATQQQSQTSRTIGEQAFLVRDYTKHLKRAMGEQEIGSHAISRAMDNVTVLVQSVLESTGVLAAESSRIVKAMEVIQHGSREASFGVTELNQMANTLSHESELLEQELARFTLPEAAQGGSITTATILWQQLTLDPVELSAVALSYMGKAVESTLLAFGEGAELIPGLAERWEVQDQGHIYRFHLRRGVKFHNGRTLEAKDIHDNFVRLLSPELRSAGAWILRNVRGAADVLSGKTQTLAGFTIIDALTFEVQLDEPIAFFLSLLTMNETGIIACEEARDRQRVRMQPQGTGPFKVEDAIDGQRVKLRANRDYFIPGQPHVDELVFRLDLRSARDVTNAFVNGELDIAHGIPLKMVREMREDPRFAPYMLSTIQQHTSYMAYDCSTAPFDKVEVRQAFNYAIDRGKINDRAYDGLGAVAASLLPPGLLGYDANARPLGHDPERARSLLRQAGYGSGFQVEYRSWDTDEFYNSGMVPSIIEDLESVGIHVTVTRHSAPDARRPLQTKGHGNIFCGNWFADFPDPDNFFYIFFHSESTAVPGIFFHSPALDQKIIAGRRSNDIEQRAAIYRELDQLVVREAPLVSLFHDRLFVVQKPEVRSLRTSLVPPAVRYHDVWIEQA